MQVFQDDLEVGMEHLPDLGIEEEVGTHVKKELVPYSVNYKDSVP
jgi:hypothetical protein